MSRQKAAVQLRPSEAISGRIMPLADDEAQRGGLPPCLQCGACCFSDNPRYVRVSGNDHARLGELADTFTQFIQNRCYMKIEGDRCAALEIDPVRGRFPCRLYGSRPQICRELVRGSPQCLAELERKRDRVRGALSGCARNHPG